MKTAGLVLGIIGGILAIILGFVYILGGIAADAIVGSTDQLSNTLNELDASLSELSDQMEAEGWTVDDSDYGLGDLTDELEVSGLDSAYDATVGAAITSAYIFGILAIIGGILGIIGGALIKKKNILAGIFLIIGAITGFFVALGFLASILFIIAAIFAFIPDKKASVMAA